MKLKITYTDGRERVFECDGFDTTMGTVMLYRNDEYKSCNPEFFYITKDYSEVEFIDG